MELQAMDERMERLKRFVKEHGWGPLGSVMFHSLAIMLVIGFAADAVVEKEEMVEIIMETKAEPIPEPEKKEENIDKIQPVDLNTDVAS